MLWLAIAIVGCLLFWAPFHMLWLVPYVGGLILSGQMTLAAGNLIGLYSSLIPLALIFFAMWRSKLLK